MLAGIPGRIGSVELTDNLARQFHLRLLRMHPAYRAQLPVRQKLEVSVHQFITDRHHFAELVARRLVDADVIAERFGHLLYAVQPFQKRRHDHDLRLLAVSFLNLPSHEKVELLIRPAQLYVSL